MATNNNIQIEQAKILYQQSPIVLFATLLLVFLVSTFFASQVEHIFLIPWAIWVLALTIARAYLVRTFLKKEEIESPNNWLKIYTTAAFVSGVSWGVLLLQVVNPVSGNEVLVLSLILTGMIAGSLLPLSSYLPAYFTFSVPMLLPFAIKMFTSDGDELQFTGLLIIIFLVSMLGFSVMVNRNILDSIKLRLRNSHLLDDLRIQKEFADDANRDKSRFLAATSHDLRQPLYALDLYLGALRIELENTKQFELLDRAKLSSKTLGYLLNALMDVSKLDSGAVIVNPKYFNLMTVLLEACKEYEQQAKDKGIEIKANLQEVSVNTDPILLGRMLRNLISNAVNHNENCSLTISTTLVGNLVRIDIRDSGKGIAASELENIFSEFYQLNNPERDRNKGLGLGLAIVKRLSQLLDIPIVVESEEGKGTGFSLTVAIVENKRQLERLDEIDVVHNLEIAGLFIIVIEDEKNVRDATKILLRSWGCEVLAVSSESELITTLSQDNYPIPDLVISDYRLRDKKSGIDAVYALHDYFNTQIPTLMITGDSSEEIVTEIEAHNYAMLLKPVSSQILSRKIESILKAK
jgi:signal transduction histidine kinase/CheY-like chemotaxis protein